MPSPILRQRLLSNEWVAVAPDRARRPHLFARSPQRVDADPGGCPFCKLGEGPAIRAVPNRYPALLADSTAPASPGSQPQSPIYNQQPARGLHEVLVEAKEHVTDWRRLSSFQLAEVFHLWQRRLADFAATPGVSAVVLFKNQGALAGASIPHVHSQIAALPLIPPRTQTALLESQRYHQVHQRCLLCDVIYHEEHMAERLVAASDSLLAMTPFGSRASFETWLLPRRHQADFSHIRPSERQELATMVHTVLTAWRAHLGEVDFNLILRSVPFAFAGEPYYHWHLEMLPRTSQVAGFELSSGMYINAVPSEEAARLLRESILQG